MDREKAVFFISAYLLLPLHASVNSMKAVFMTSKLSLKIRMT